MDSSLWPACVKAHGFNEQLQAAASAGFERLPIGGPMVRRLQNDGLTFEGIVRRAASSGIRLGHYDGFTDWAPRRFSPALPPAAQAVFDFSCAECLDICGALGLDAICATGAFVAGEFPLNQLADGFAHFCEQADALGIRVDLEFIPMWGIPDLASAWDIVRHSGARNAGVLFDTWHFCRGDGDFALLASLPAGAITTVQLADASGKTAHLPLLEECLRFRRPPGEGDLPLLEILTILRDKGGVMDIGPEVFSDELDGLAAIDAVKRVSAATRALLEQAKIPQQQ